MLDPLDVNVTLRNELSLPVKLCVKLGILSLTIVIDRPLFVDLGPERLDETNVGIDA